MTIENEAQKPETSELVELFALDLTMYGDQVYYFVRGSLGDTPIIWRDNEYIPVDFESDGFELNGAGSAPQPRIRFSVTNQMITGLINDYQDLISARVTRTKTYFKFLDGQPTANPDAHFPLDIFRVERKSRENKYMVEFELSSILDQQGRLLPGRTINANYCPWVYRRSKGTNTGNPLNDFTYHEADNKCPFIGNTYFDLNDNPVASPTQDRCGKRVTSCKKRFGADAELPFGGFPGAARAMVG